MKPKKRTIHLADVHSVSENKRDKDHLSFTVQDGTRACTLLCDQSTFFSFGGYLLSLSTPVTTRGAVADCHVARGALPFLHIP